MKVIRWVVLTCLAAWGWSVWMSPPADMNAWWWRKELINLSGVLSFVLMGLIMVLAVRPAWLEKPFGGLDKMYRVHKWAGILAISFALLHYGLDLAKDVMRLFFERPVRGPRPEFWLDFLRGPVKDMGEWSVWLLGAMLLITLWQRFPYHIWRYVHKVLAVVFVVLALHAIVLAPPAWWMQPMGVLVGIAAVAGSVCAVLALSGRIGRSRTHRAVIVSVEPQGDSMLEVVCRVSGDWQHQPGQFAFLRAAGHEGQHPFTIASAQNAGNTLRFCIKKLGDYTARLPALLKAGDEVSIEGPYGCFELQRDIRQEQVWIAGGIGITPFLAWLEALQSAPGPVPVATLHYCVRSAADAVHAERLQALCATLPTITLVIHCSDEEGRPSAAALRLLDKVASQPQVWFCGPQGLGDSLEADLARAGLARGAFHREAFQMR
ncbi:ferredoxin reductase family protein [Chitinilyticum aquatile]|uniref:ferredoxin reductase family protein n=1 Tax=Chitinilyticum aquatile TaxID=362520 RepID=UPI0003FA3C58|nr:ferric reductase-like transmembrane domain-containing protein [Chitinilyticum aquatile]